MSLEFATPLTINNIEAQLEEFLKQTSLPSLSKEVIDELWLQYKKIYFDENVPNALTFFISYMPPLKFESTHQEMIDSTLSKSFDAIYKENDLKTLFKILGSDIRVVLKEKYLSQLLLQPDIVKRLGAAHKDHACMEAWLKLKDASNGINIVELLYHLLHSDPKPPWMSQNIEIFLERQKLLIPNELKDMLKSLTLPYYKFDLQLKQLMKYKNEHLIHNIFLMLGEMINDTSIPFEQRFEIFKSSFDVLCNNINLEENEIQNYHPVFFSFLKFILLNFNNNEVKDHLYSAYEFQNNLLLKLKLHQGADIDTLLTIINDSNFKSALQTMYPTLARMYKNMQNKLYMFDLKRSSPVDLALETKINNVFSDLHEANLTTFSQMILPEEMSNEPQVSFIEPNFEKVIYNQKGYDEGILLPSGAPYIIGNPLTLKDGTPIGYNIHLPKGQPKGVFVHVYGGNNVKYRKKRMFYPGVLGDIENDLLNKGIAVVSLNVADLIESNDFCYELPKNIEDKIQHSIHEFYDTLKFHPDKLHADLKLPQNIPFCLYGASFGGRTVIKHAERYPKTYDRVISFDGSLSYEMGLKSDLPFLGRRDNPEQRKAQVYLDAIHDVDKIVDDVLLLHNMNDNNVNLKVTLDWYKKAKKAGIKDKVDLYITDIGSQVQKEELPNTGHFPTRNQKAFNNMMEVIFNHIEKGSSKVPVLSEWSKLRYNILANKNYKSASIEEKFISLAYRQHQQGIQIKDDFYYVLHYLSTTPTALQQQYINDLHLKNELTEDAISCGLSSYLEQFLHFLKEKEGIPIPEKINIINLVQNQALRDQYRDTLVAGPKGNQANFNFIISTLYTANPQLLAPFIEALKNDTIVQNNLKKAREKLNKKLSKEGKLSDVAQQEVKTVLTPARTKLLLLKKSAVTAREESKIQPKQNKQKKLKPTN